MNYGNETFPVLHLNESGSIKQFLFFCLPKKTEQKIGGGEAGGVKEEKGREDV